VVADAEGEVDLDVTDPEVAPAEEVPAGIPVEASRGDDAETEEGSSAA
jgi:hypothetical protein